MSAAQRARSSICCARARPSSRTTSRTPSSWTASARDARCTYAELDARARADRRRRCASAACSPGDRALLLYPPGLDFIPAFFGCLYAGVIAVPAYPPQPAQASRTLPRLLEHRRRRGRQRSCSSNASVVERRARMMRRGARRSRRFHGSRPTRSPTTAPTTGAKRRSRRDDARVPAVHVRIDRVAARRDGQPRQPAAQPRVRESRRGERSRDACRSRGSR